MVKIKHSKADTKSSNQSFRMSVGTKRKKLLDQMDIPCVAKTLLNRARRLIKKSAFKDIFPINVLQALVKEIGSICSRQDIKTTLKQLYLVVFGNSFSNVIPVNSKDDDIYDTPFLISFFRGRFKRRVYDIDSMKKQFKKCCVNFIRNKILSLSSVGNIHMKNPDFKHDTNKSNEIQSLNLTVADIFQKCYGIDRNMIFTKIITGSLKACEGDNDDKDCQVQEEISSEQRQLNEKLLNSLLNKTMREALEMYRNSSEFIEEAKKNSKGDREKLKRYLLLSFKFFNYLNCNSVKPNLKTIPIDEGVSANSARILTELDSIELNFKEIKDPNENELILISDEDTSLYPKNTQELSFIQSTNLIEQKNSVDSLIMLFNQLSESNKQNFLEQIGYPFSKNYKVDLIDKLEINNNPIPDNISSMQSPFLFWD